MKSDQERAVRLSAQNLSAWDTVQRGWWHLRRVTKKDNAEARSLFQKAIEADPQFARAFACVALTHNLDILNQWSDSPEQSVAELNRAAQRAVKLDNDDAMGHLALSTAYARLGEQEQAISAAEFALQLNPGLAAAYRFLGMQLAFVGRAHEAIVNLEKALRLSPRDLAIHECLWAMSLAHFAAGQYEEALVWAQRSRQEKPEYLFASLALAATYARLERIEEARSALKEVLRLSPGFSLTALRSAMAGGDASLVERVIDSLRKAGLPE
jgi:tetratricopeptide (TPR) repeat protein